MSTARRADLTLGKSRQTPDLKTKIEPITGALDLIGQLQGVRFEWRSPEAREVGKTLPLPLNSPHVGFIAQDVAKIVPEAVVMPRPGPDGIYGLREDNLIPFLVEAIKAQQVEISLLKAKMAALETQLARDRTPH